MLVPLSIIIIFLGVYPSSMLNLMNSSVNAMVKFMMDSKALYGSITGF
jgi:NADH-quinone oxidoreductase subunit M